MIHPRLTALAERAWHKASWESYAADDDDMVKEQSENWAEFANSLGHKELLRLDNLDVAYHLPPPGARYAYPLVLPSPLTRHAYPLVLPPLGLRYCLSISLVFFQSTTYCSRFLKM